MQIFRVILLTVILLIVTACGTRIPFKEKAPLENAALVYVYVKENITSDDDLSTSNYKIRINNKQTEGRLNSKEYMVFNVKPQTIDFSATRTQIEEKIITLNLQAGEIYYLRIIGNLDGGTFEMNKVSISVGRDEIKDTGLSGSTAIDADNLLTELIGEDKDEAVVVQESPTKAKQASPIVQQQSYVPVKPASKSVSSMSKLDEIQQAYKLKEQGILTDEEFKTMKTKIISK